MALWIGIILLATTTLQQSSRYLVGFKGDRKSYHATFTSSASAPPTSYSFLFNHDELHSALISSLPPNSKIALSFTPAQKASPNAHLQWVTTKNVPETAFIEACSRCATVRTVHKTIASGETMAEVTLNALKTIPTERKTWSLRLRDFNSIKFGRRLRSPAGTQLERDAIFELKPFLEQLIGDVDLTRPERALYILSGVDGGKYLLSEQISNGFESLAQFQPVERGYLTSTPLEAATAFVMLNLGLMRAKSNFSVLDPYAGSASLLQAAKYINPNAKCLAVERDWKVNFSSIRQNFDDLNLSTEDLKFVRADFRDHGFGNNQFDLIICDPPYGLRELLDARRGENSSCSADLLFAVQQKNLLKGGGRLVFFHPVTTNEEGVVTDEHFDIDERYFDLIHSFDQYLSGRLTRRLLVLQKKLTT